MSARFGLGTPLPRRAGLLRRAVATTAAAGILAGALVATGGAANAAPFAGVQQPTSFEDGRYIVTLVDDAVATYEGGVAGLQATKPEEGTQLDARSAPAEDYSEHLEETQEAVADSVGAEIDYSYTLALNGFTAVLTAKQAAELSTRRDVASIQRDELRKVTATPSTEFLGLEGENGVWAQTGGAETAGEGIVLGVLDTGIAPENASFAGDALGTAAGDEPYRSGDAILYEKADGGTFTGACQTGPAFGADDCSTKIIGARYFVAGFGADNIGDGSTGTGEYLSPRDGDGHGSHTASTAAGNHEVETTVLDRSFGTISGVAPAAKVAAYKVCWSGPDNASSEDDGCANSDLVAAIDQAVKDGVDVINFSIGGGSATTTVSPTDEAFFGAAAAGIFVSASAGNSGPGASTLDNAAPWITTVAASTIPSYEATATLGDGQAFPGASITVTERLSGPLVTAASVAAAGAETPELCGPGTLDPAKAAGMIVLCNRGVVDRVAKSAEVAHAGGIGMLLVNTTPGSVDTDAHGIPTVHLDAQYYEAVAAYAATPGATVTFSEGNTTEIVVPTPQVAGFSSRGPVLADGSDILKPDIAAPGVAILAAGPNREGEEGTYEFLSGTSMAAPHVAGLALLYLGERPAATPAEIKSALMTTAYNTVDAEGAAVPNPFAQGAGHADPTRFFEPGLLYLNGQADWLAYIQGVGAYDLGIDPLDPSQLNLASIAIGSLAGSETITRTVTSTQAGTFTADVDGLAGVDAVVSPSTLEFTAPGQEQSYTVTFTRTDAPLDEFATGSLTWTSGDTEVRSPVAVQPVALAAPGAVEGTGITGSVDVPVTPGSTGEVPLEASGLAAGTKIANADDPASPYTGTGGTGDQREYEVVVPEGTSLARFSLDAADDTGDLDLYVLQLDAEGTPVTQFSAATGAADERVDLPSPDAATYVVVVDVYAQGTGENAGSFDVRSFLLQPGSGEGAFTVTPQVLAGVQGTPASYTASWTGLAPETEYLGLVEYGDTGLSTAVTVSSGPADEVPTPQAPVATAPPTISGTPLVGRVLRATPGQWDTEGLTYAYQWLSDGEPIRNATSASYRVKGADQGAALSVVVTATAEGRPAGTAQSAEVTVKHAATVRVRLDRHIALSSQRVKATIVVRSSADAAPTGTVAVTVGSRTLDVTLDDRGRGTVTLPKLGRGAHAVTASYAGDASTAAASSRPDYVWVVF
ncbi:S8 family serine peptidase [Planctomonas deserti]|uniref:S8 family serine peptidase n=1 Tax=Planctomonas deserti TaxID=2144185 RepID=UPI000D3B8D33|nr:S8 family serine peptidase [Planctomonas deserti]